MPYNKCYEKNLSKAVRKYFKAFNPVNYQFSIFYQSLNMMIHNINIIYFILAPKVSCQDQACFVIIRYFHLSNIFLQ